MGVSFTTMASFEGSKPRTSDGLPMFIAGNFGFSEMIPEAEACPRRSSAAWRIAYDRNLIRAWAKGQSSLPRK